MSKNKFKSRKRGSKKTIRQQGGLLCAKKWVSIAAFHRVQERDLREAGRIVYAECILTENYDPIHIDECLGELFTRIAARKALYPGFRDTAEELLYKIITDTCKDLQNCGLKTRKKTKGSS